MSKKLTKLGNSYGIVIDKPILELLKITPETALELSTDGNALLITPIRSVSNERALEVARKLMREHAETLSKLAK